MENAQIQVPYREGQLVNADVRRDVVLQLEETMFPTPLDSETSPNTTIKMEVTVQNRNPRALR